MNIDNVALVRATNILPYDGILKSISNSPYLCKKNSTEFSFMISDLLKKLGLIPKPDYSRMDEENYLDEYGKEVARIIKEYLPYSSDYNSMILFSLNGLCPDDNEHGFANNTFSNKKCAIIEPLSNHIDDVISLVPTDTAIKGDVVLSSDSVVLIDKNYYDSLTDENKKRLEGLNITFFEGNLEIAVNNFLKNSNKYVPEKLSLTRNNNGYIPSDTSEEQIKNINQIANDYNKPQVLFFNILSKQNDDLDRLTMVDSEIENSKLVEEYYLKRFLEVLVSKIGLDESFKNSNIIYDKDKMKQLSDAINSYGIDSYKQLVDSYNKELEDKRNNKTLETPNQIIDSIKNKHASNEEIVNKMITAMENGTLDTDGQPINDRALNESFKVMGYAKVGILIFTTIIIIISIIIVGILLIK